jgi:hypothetical protein
MKYMRSLYDTARKTSKDDFEAWTRAIAGYHGGEGQLENIRRTGNIAPRSDGMISTGR